MVGLDACRLEIQRCGIGHPPDRDHHDTGLRAVTETVLREVHAHAVSGLLERFDGPEVFPHHHPSCPKGRRDRGRDIFVLGRQNTRARLEELDPRPECVEDRSDLRTSCSSADDQHRGWHRREAPRVAVCGRIFDPRNREPAGYAACANDHLFGVQPQSTLCLDCVRVHEPRHAGAFMDGHSGGIDLPAEGRMGSHVIRDLAHASEQPAILQRRLAHGDAVLPELSGFSDQTGGVGQRTHGHGSIVGRHPSELLAGHEGGLRAQICCAERGNHPRRPGADDHDVEHAFRPTSPDRRASEGRAIRA